MKQSSVSWTRLAAEAGAIVLSILLALGVDEWRTARVDRGLENEYLLRILEDLASNDDVLEVQRSSESSQITAARLVYPIVTHGDWSSADTSAVVVASYLASPSPTPTWVDDTFQELKSTGRMSLIRSASVRAELLAYYRFLEAHDYAYQLMSTEYRDALRGRMDPDVQLRIREACRPREASCPVDVDSPELRSFVAWLDGNPTLAEGLRKVIVQWTRGETEYLPEVAERTQQLREVVEAELEK